jgi:uncharacterized protein
MASNTAIDVSDWEDRFASFLDERADESDAAHDRAHIERVVASARHLARSERAAMEVVIPAAWLHDCVVLPKDHPRRSEASRLAAQTAIDFLTDAGYPSQTHADIRHAIEAHSYSAGISPETLEADIVQDADRLDALGAVGIARCFQVGGQIGASLYHPDDPFCEDREPDDATYSIDHFYAKLLRLPDTMNTGAARKEAERRAGVMRDYLGALETEIHGCSGRSPEGSR